ncbi:MAG: EAL domain-containing protein [Terracidiphilus sp.]
MAQTTRRGVLAGRAVVIALAISGMAVGCLLGCALALVEAGNSLKHSAEAAAARQNAALADARSALQAMEESRSGFCSDAEIAGFRLLVFRSEYLKDAGRIRSGRIECSAMSGHPARAIAPFKPLFRLHDATLAYRDLSPLRIRGPRRAALQSGSDYVVFGLEPSAAQGPFPARLLLTMQAFDAPPTKLVPKAADKRDPPYLTSEGTGRFGNTLYATRCTDPAFSCVAATTTVSAALQGESRTVSLWMVGGGIAGVLFDLGFSFLFIGNRDMGRRLRRAVESGKLEVRYQPIVSLETRQIVGAEALARWTDQHGSEVDPEVFVKIAEEQGFIGLITESVLKRALRDFGPTLRSRPEFRLSINVGAPDLVEPRFLPMLEGALEKARVRPESLVVEITERSAANGEAAKETIRLLRQIGHSIHIDDFGSGFSNLDKLLYLYADTIKIDKAFTRTIDTESVAAVILPHIMKIAKSLNLEVIVEGVEITRQADYFLPGKQKIYGQGWLFGRPMTAEQFLSHLGCRPVPAQLQAEGYGALDSTGGAIHVVTSLTA